MELVLSRAYELDGIVEYKPGSVITRSIIQKKTGHISVSSFDAGEMQVSKISPFDHLVMVIDGVAEVIIDETSTHLEKGEIMIIPAHATSKLKANKRFKVLSVLIKSGYEDVEL